MKKHIILILTICMLFIFGLSTSLFNDSDASDASNATFTIRFMDNKASSVSLESGYEALGTNLLFTTKTVEKNNVCTAPATTPTLNGYDFAGWYLDKEMKTIYDFASPVTKNMTLYAGYTRNSSTIQEELYEEVKLSFTETVDDSIGNDINITGVLNTKIQNNVVKLASNAINKLTAKKTNCIEYINYVRKSTVSNLTATFNTQTNKINISYSIGSTPKSIEITVQSTTYTITSNSYYETKAAKYDQTSYIDYSTLLCGSSSMENWATSTEDLEEFVSYNIGIGGTIVSHWDNLMNPRLVYVNNPKQVVYYLGINNIINNGDSGTSTGNQLVAMFNHVHEALPNTKISFIMINYVPGYMKYKTEIDTANNIVKAYAEGKDYMNLINAGSLLLDSNNEPSWAYFKTDGLHMSLAGYLVWGNYVRESLIDFEKESYKK